MIRGYILDTYVDHKKNVLVTWLINNGKTSRIEDKFEPSFYVYSSQNSLFKLASDLQDIPQVKYLNFTQHKIMLGSEKKYLVLEVIPKTLASFNRLASMIDKWGKYRTYGLYNVDIRISTRYLQHKGVFCNARVKWDGKQYILEDDQWAIDYLFPEFKELHFNVEKKTGFQSLSDPLTAIYVDGNIIAEDNEADTLLTAVKQIREKDPDIVYTIEGDSFLLPYLYHRAKECNISREINLGRDKTQRKRPVKQAKSYFSYGQIVYRPAFFTLMGRAHIDRNSSFLYGESGLRGLVDISRCANIPLQLQSRLGPGTAISQIQVNRAIDKGYLIPWKKNMPEKCKTARQLLISDRGGLILSPSVGLHDDVVELDFASLYPNVMFRFNISPETMLCNCCLDSHIRVPQLGYHICYRKTGLLPEVLRPIIHRRFCFKARAKNKRYDPVICKEIQQAWKWILIVCFGYTGYRNARFGRIECHESITAFARDILLEAIEVAEQAGYRVLHGIIDSLWITTIKDDVDPYKLSRMISKRTGIRMDVEGRYKWIVFLPSKQFDVGALNRYYGLFDNGELKVRGIELRQRNTPEFLREVQQNMLNVLQKANKAKEFYDLIPQAVEALLDIGKQLIDGKIDSNKLVFKNRISRYVTEYKVNNLVKSALLQLRDLDIRVEPGQYVQYVVTDEHSRNYKDRVCVIESLTGNEQIDIDYYLRQIAKCGESILVPFGYTLENLELMLQQKKRGENIYGSILQRVRTNQTCF
jgi:DNA polymerase elongation subunit (family B)